MEIDFIPRLENKNGIEMLPQCWR